MTSQLFIAEETNASGENYHLFREVTGAIEDVSISLCTVSILISYLS